MMRLIRVVCFSVALMSLTGSLLAQDDLISGSVKDANYLIKGYTSPLLNALGTGFNQGWYNTAKVHKKFGFDFTVSISDVAIPSEDEFFTVDNSKLETLELLTDHSGNSNIDPGTGKGKVPSVFGPSKTQSQFYNPTTDATIDGTGGQISLNDLPMKRMPVPIYNIGFGLPKNFEIKIRFMPTIGPPEANFSFFGIGLMNDVKQYIPGLKMAPIDLAVFVGYTKMKLESELDTSDPSLKGSGEVAVSSTTIQALISKKVSVLTFYGGMGYDFSNSTIAAMGWYDLNGDGTEQSEEKNPIDVSTSLNGFRGTLGMRLKLGVITLHGDYSFQKYNTFTAGFGINVR